MLDFSPVSYHVAIHIKCIMFNSWLVFLSTTLVLNYDIELFVSFFSAGELWKIMEKLSTIISISQVIVIADVLYYRLSHFLDLQ